MKRCLRLSVSTVETVIISPSRSVHPTDPTNCHLLTGWMDDVHALQVNSYPMTRGFTAIGVGGDDFVQAMVLAVESVLQNPVPQVTATPHHTRKTSLKDEASKQGFK